MGFEQKTIEQSDCQAKINDAQRKQELLQDFKSNEEGFANQLKKELAETQARAKEAAVKEQTYTWGMWGVFTHVWQNDVNLARKNKEDLECQAEKLKDRIEKIKDDTSENIKNEMMNTNSTDLQEAITKKGLCIKATELAKKKILRLENSIREQECRLEKIVSEEGRVSVEHLLQANNAMQSLGQMGAKAEGVDRVFQD